MVKSGTLKCKGECRHIESERSGVAVRGVTTGSPKTLSTCSRGWYPGYCHGAGQEGVRTTGACESTPFEVHRGTEIRSPRTRPRTSFGQFHFALSKKFTRLSPGLGCRGGKVFSSKHLVFLPREQSPCNTSSVTLLTPFS